MATEIEQLRDALADSVSIVKKGQDKTISKMDEIQDKKEQRYKVKETDKKASQQAILSQIKDVETAIKNQKEVESISINNPEAITGDLRAGLEGIINTLKEELKNFDKNIVVKNDFSNFASLFKSSQDKKSVIEALKKIEDKLGEKEEKEEVDYTMILSDIAEALEVKEELLPTLKAILEKELSVTVPDIMDVNLNPRLIDNDRVRVILRDDQVANITSSSNTVPVVNTMKDGTAKAQLVDDGGRVASVDDSTNSLQTINYEHHEIHSGSHYYISGHQQFTNAQVIDFTIITPNTAKWTHLLFTVTGSDAESVNIYEGATVNVAGTPVTAFNNNRNSTNVTGNIIRTGDTFTSTGTLISRRFAGATKSSGTISRGSELILKQNTTYIFRIKNETTLMNNISWDAEWYEHQDKTS